jgi:hypothetical protein
MIARRAKSKKEAFARGLLLSLPGDFPVEQFRRFIFG